MLILSCGIPKKIHEENNEQLEEFAKIIFSLYETMERLDSTLEVMIERIKNDAEKINNLEKRINELENKNN
jgi:uncharacterized protein Yka (UPF0111/DUF47 family)